MSKNQVFVPLKQGIRASQLAEDVNGLPKNTSIKYSQNTNQVLKKVQAGNDQENAQSERNSHSKNQRGNN